LLLQPDDELRGILLRTFPGCRIDACAPLAGGVSARAVAVDVALPDSSARRVVVRRPAHGSPEEALRAAGHEYRLLLHCAKLGLPVPEPCALDAEAAAVVVGYVAGRPEFAPPDASGMLEQMADQLVRIHGVGARRDLAFLERYTDRTARNLLQPPRRLDHTLGEPRLRAAVGRLWPWRQHNPDTLLHGDYWPGNLLWDGGELVAVLDWEEAAVGDPLADLAVARLDVLWAFGEAAMHDFTRCYRERAEIDWRNLPHWDLCAALRPMSNLARWAASYAPAPICRPDVTELTLRDGHARFVAGALRSLGIAP
jgi:aminoglycoside phosphotransferase (APT) family kinase protein